MSGRDELVDETLSGKFLRKARTAPFLMIGIAGMLGVCGVGAYKFKNKGAMSTSVFLMQLRVTAQGTVIGCLMLGLVYQMLNEHVLSDKKKNSE